MHQSDSPALGPNRPETSVGQPRERAEESADTRSGLFALEIVFLAFIALVTIGAFAEALTYKLVSSRTPFVIMVPLSLLIAIHARRIWRVRRGFSAGATIGTALRGGFGAMNKALAFIGWMVAFVAIIAVLGHYIGVFALCFMLMRVGRERWVLSLAVAAGVTFFIYGTFEYLFNIDLYRGLLFRWFMGYRDF